MKNSKKIKIAFFADVLKENTDGVTYTIYNIVERIPKDKFDYLFITPDPPSDLVHFPYPVYVCKSVKFPHNKDYSLAFPYFDSKLKKVLDEFNPDMIHFTTPSFLGHYATKYGLQKKIPVFSTYHTHFISYIEYFKILFGISKFIIWLMHIFMRWFYNNCIMTFVPSLPIKEEIIKIGIDEERLTIWGRGIDTDLFNPGMRDNAYIDNLCGKDTKRILFVSRLVWEKEIKTLVGIYNYFNKTRPDVKMIITGEGPQRSYLEKNMPNAVFTGKLVDKELSRIYASSDIFVFPSITETFGNVVLEALASGLPAVVAAQGGPKGIVIDGITGYHIKPKKIDDFCEKISYLLDNPGIAKNMSKNAVTYALSQRWDILCQEMFDVYESTLLTYEEKNIEVLHDIAV